MITRLLVVWYVLTKQNYMFFCSSKGNKNRHCKVWASDEDTIPFIERAKITVDKLLTDCKELEEKDDRKS